MDAADLGEDVELVEIIAVSRAAKVYTDHVRIGCVSEGLGFEW